MIVIFNEQQHYDLWTAIFDKNFGGPSHLHSHSQGTHTTHNGINSHSYNTKGERVEREEERTYCIVFFFYTLAYN
jgi:hypothetical protein